VCTQRSPWSVKTKSHGPRSPVREKRIWPQSLGRSSSVGLDWSKMNSPPSPAVMSGRASPARHRCSSLPSSSSILVLLRSFQHPAGGPRRRRRRLRDPCEGTGQSSGGWPTKDITIPQRVRRLVSVSHTSFCSIC
jgi:hypothetical protein